MKRFRTFNPFRIPRLPAALAGVLLIGAVAFPAVAEPSGQPQKPETWEHTQSAAQDPGAVIERFHATLLEVMKNAETLGPKGRFETLTPKVEEAFDLTRWVRLAMNNYWLDATPSQKDQLISAFKKICTATYAVFFDGYSGESFKTISVQSGPRDSKLVRTQIVRTDKRPVNLTYVLFKVEEQWRIVDVLLDNTISQLSVRRSEFKSILQESGIDGLITKLEDTTAKIL